jgi:predicted DNA-binding transcriptional regulator AlpA
MKDSLTKTPLPPVQTATHDPLLAARLAARYVGLSLPAFWRGVASGRFHRPYYPAPRAPRWRQSQLDADVHATQAMPSEAKQARRAARIAAETTPSETPASQSKQERQPYVARRPRP